MTFWARLFRCEPLVCCDRWLLKTSEDDKITSYGKQEEGAAAILETHMRWKETLVKGKTDGQ